MFSLGVVTARDEWVYDFDEELLANQVQFLIDSYNNDSKLLKGKSKDEIKDLIGKRDKRDIKWTRAVINDLSNGKEYKFNGLNFRISTYRPFVEKLLYFASELNEMQYQLRWIYPKSEIRNLNSNISIGFIGNDTLIPFSALVFNQVEDYNCLSNAANGTKTLPLYIYDSENQKHENITDWGLTQFQNHYKSANGTKITKQDIFYYTYAVLHSPVYRRKYEQNLKREFPRLPFYEDFSQWRDWGQRVDGFAHQLRNARSVCARKKRFGFNAEEEN
ncbi:MAG: type ISP restriction/modification enzyme [Pyrinomonadaceae bacterium]